MDAEVKTQWHLMIVLSSGQSSCMLNMGQRGTKVHQLDVVKSGSEKGLGLHHLIPTVYPPHDIILNMALIGFSPNQLDMLFVSHLYQDHLGLLPLVIKGLCLAG